MKHIIIGGDGFVGHMLAAELAARGEQVIVADITNSGHAIYTRVPFVRVDVTAPETLAAIPLDADDMVYNLSAKMLSPLQVRAKRRDFFWPVNHGGPSNILAWMEAKGARRMIQFTTDMVFGHVIPGVRQDEDHPMAPLGEYGASKKATEELCHAYRAKGFNITIFRPRLIIGPGRLGILAKLFRLIDANLPVPMIGSGDNPYQFIAVQDCASAAIAGWQAGVPNRAYNLGSDNPPPVRELLGNLIRHAGSKSFLLPTPAWAVKRTLALFDLINLPIMDPEQYLIADEFCIRETGRARAELGWAPRHHDSDMLNAAYAEYRKAKATGQIGTATTIYQHSAER
jgi:dTDP-glucose 4,6-dehydratase